MIEKFLFICLIIFNSQRLIRSDFTDEFDLISWQKNGTPKRESVTFIDTPYLVFYANRTTKDEYKYVQLDCKNQTKEQNLCSDYQANAANCTNLNYRKSGVPDWKCDYLDLDSKVVASGQIRCASPLDTLPEDVPFIYKKDTCTLTYSLKLINLANTLKSISNQDPHRIIAFKDTSFIWFKSNTENKGEDINLFECKDEAKGEHCKFSEVLIVFCSNLNYQNSDFPKWKCEYNTLIPKFFVTSFDITCENPFPSQQPPTHYKENTCFLSFTLKVNETVATFKETSYLVFNKLEQTKGKIPIPQLKCKEDSSDDLCTNSTIEKANCTNLNYQKHSVAKWDCKFMVLNPGFSIKNDINCESPDGSKTESYYSFFYDKETCSLEYTLFIAKSPETDPSDFFIQTLLMVFCFLVVLFVAFMCITCCFRFCPGCSDYTCSNCLEGCCKCMCYSLCSILTGSSGGTSSGFATTSFR